jgi:hypothetical protein
VIAAPTGAGKTRATAKHAAKTGSTCWLADRREQVDEAAAFIRDYGGKVGKVESLEKTCDYPGVIKCWQEKGYNYQVGYCRTSCERKGNPEACEFLASIRDLEDADNICVTKALARGEDFFRSFGNQSRKTVVLDEDPIGLLRPVVTITREELGEYLVVLSRIEKQYLAWLDEHCGDEPLYVEVSAALGEAALSRKAAEWLWRLMAGQPPDGQPVVDSVPANLNPPKVKGANLKKIRAAGRKRLRGAFHRMMRQDPEGTVRNVLRDLTEMTTRGAGRSVLATHAKAVYHLRVTVPNDKQMIVLDATVNPELLRPLFGGRPVEVCLDDRVEPAGRVIQFMDFNGPRSYLNKIPRKLVAIIDALGDRHPNGKLVLISHKSCVDELAKASKHNSRIKTAYFGDLRGRNDLEPRKNNPVACHIVAGSPKTTEEDRRQLALAVYGRGILPFTDLETVRRPVVGYIPHELAESEGQRWLWEVRIKGYTDPRMHAVHDHTVTMAPQGTANRSPSPMWPTSCGSLWRSTGGAPQAVRDRLMSIGVRANRTRKRRR